MRLWQTNPFQGITMTRGSGCTVWDESGKPYLDLLSGTWCNVLGYGHPQWVNAVRDQAAKLTHIGAPFMTVEMNDGLAKLAEILPPQLNRAVFLNTGSEAVELAIKMARAASGAHAAAGADGIGVFERGYYGATTYALALSEAGRAAHYLPSLGKVYRLPAPDCRHCPAGRSETCDGKYTCLDTLENMIGKENDHISAVLYEPVISSEMLVPPIGFGARLRELTSRCNALLIAEEVTTGMGRTGRWFGFQHENIVPDILVIGKIIGGGLPVSVVVTTEEVEKRCMDTMLRHVQSHQNDPFSGRIAAAVISIMQEERLVELAAKRGDYLMAGLKEIQSSIPCIADVRGRGAMGGIELHKDRANKGTAIAQRLLEEGFIVGYNPAAALFRLFPPFVISTQEIDAFLKAFEQALLECDA